MTHEDVKMLLPHLKRISIEYVDKNPDLIARGEALWVTDKKRHTIPYVVPNLTFEEVDKIDMKLDYEEAINIDILEDYEVKQALKKSKKNISLNRKLVKELSKRDIKTDKSFNYKLNEQRCLDKIDDYKETNYE